jgi:very-short-patch-repair endonuclease
MVSLHTPEQLRDWLAGNEGIAHREQIRRAGFGVATVRVLVGRGDAGAIRRSWIALPGAAADLRGAAAAGGQVSCLSLARRRGWWIPPSLDEALHLHLLPGSASVRHEADAVVRHWTKPLVPMGRSLIASIEDALQHIAGCVDRDGALVLWESAARTERLSPEAIRSVGWTSRAAREHSAEVQGLSDSGLETLVVIPLRRRGLRVRQQVKLAGRFADLLVGDRLVLQIDGFEFHSSSRQRSQDIAHDAELRLRGFTVIRLSYAQIVHDWPRVERTIHRAVAAGLHQAS